jgi:hypothetical protein
VTVVEQADVLLSIIPRFLDAPGEDSPPQADL